MNFHESVSAYFNAITDTINKIDIEEFNRAISIIIDSYNNDGNIYIFGNGGSASTASHFANDFNKGLSEDLNKKFKFHCLNDNVPTILAIANDIGYECIFQFQLQNKLNLNDLVIGISGSGNSKNVIHAVEYAKKEGVRTISLTGYDGGELKKIADCSLHVPIFNMQITEDIHLIFNHVIMNVLKKTLKSQRNPMIIYDGECIDGIPNNTLQQF